jgi:adenylate cyclase
MLAAMSRFERPLRLGTGLVLAVYVSGHFLNHALGVVSLEAMEALRRLLAPWWRSAPGTVLLYGSLLAHFALALRSLGRRRTLRMPAWEATQIALGLLVPPLVAWHVVGTRFAWQALGREVDYPRIVWAIWSDPVQLAKQLALIAVLWLHLCFGIHFWLRLKAWYALLRPVLFALALLVPAFALAGFLRAAAREASAPPPQPLRADERAFLFAVRDALYWSFGLAVGGTIALVLARRFRLRGYRVHHPAAPRPVFAPAGASVLEALREAGIPHASVCGGRARCTTCRVRVAGDLRALPAPAPAEADALRRIGAAPNVRLACQLRPARDVHITPLVPAGATARAAYRVEEAYGREQLVAAMFVDLRGSTALAEARLPYDVVFILNQFSAEMSQALALTGGHYAQFTGDGLLALYGLRGGIGPACRAALAGAAEMQRRLAALNERLAPELSRPLRIGIGLHAGMAIVGAMGPPAAPTLTALGDTVNTAARLEALTKEFDTLLVASLETLRYAGIERAALPVHRVEVRGRTQPLEVVAIDEPAALLREARS